MDHLVSRIVLLMDDMISFIVALMDDLVSFTLSLMDMCETRWSINNTMS
jgi:hypothetical protein